MGKKRGSSNMNKNKHKVQKEISGIIDKTIGIGAIKSLLSDGEEVSVRDAIKTTTNEATARIMKVIEKDSYVNPNECTHQNYSCRIEQATNILNVLTQETVVYACWDCRSIFFDWEWEEMYEM